MYSGMYVLCIHSTQYQAYPALPSREISLETSDKMSALQAIERRFRERDNLGKSKRATERARLESQEGILART